MVGLFFTPLMLASDHGHDSIVRYLLENYSDYCIVDAENYFSRYDVDYDCDDDHLNKQAVLWLAVKQGHLNVVQTLVSLSRVNINQTADESCRLPNSYTPLYWACENKQLEMVKYLVENGADLYDVDINGSTALMIASSHEQDDMAKYLLGLDESNNRLLNAMDKDGSTALHRAAYSGYISTVKLL
jgi:ankyrin repeat protein